LVGAPCPGVFGGPGRLSCLPKRPSS